jgi:hypothetical protein
LVIFRIDLAVVYLGRIAGLQENQTSFSKMAAFDQCFYDHRNDRSAEQDSAECSPMLVTKGLFHEYNKPEGSCSGKYGQAALRFTQRSWARLWEQLQEYFEVRFRAEIYGVPYFLTRKAKR